MHLLSNENLCSTPRTSKNGSVLLARSVQATAVTAALAAMLYGHAFAQSAPAGSIALEGFETPALAPNSYTYNPVGTKWTFSGTTGSGLQRNGSIWGATTAPEGQQTAFLRGGDAHLSQVVALPAGTYNVSFYAARRAFDAGAINPLQLKINGLPIGAPIVPKTLAFTKYTSIDFQLSTSGSYKVELVSTNAAPSTYPVASFIDAVSINPVGTSPQPPVTSSGMSPACASFYAASPGFALSTSRTVDAIPTLAKPAKGVAFAEPTYKTCMVRATDHVADNVPDFARNDYSRRQAFNADDTLQLVIDGPNKWHLYDANTHTHLKELTALPQGDAEPQWSATDPKLLYFLPGYMGSEMQVKELNVSTGNVRVVGDFAARLKSLFPGSMPDNASTRAEGSPSKDGKYWCFMVTDAVAKNEYGTPLGVGVFTWDRETDTIVGSMPLKGEIPDHVSMSPSGKYCVVSSDGAIGTSAFTRDFTKKTTLLKTSQHSDLALDANGRDVYVAINYLNDPLGGNDGDVFFTDLETGFRTTLFNVYSQAGSNLHLSGKAFNKPGWILFDTNADDGDQADKKDDNGNLIKKSVRTAPTKWMQRKVLAMQLRANPTIYTLGATRALYNGYWTAPVASVNRSFTRIVFNSNWHSDSETDVDTYSIEIPADALKDVGAPSTPPTTPDSLTVALIGSVARDGYRIDYKAGTNQAAKCRSAWSSGQHYDWGGDYLTPSADGLTHSATVYLPSSTAAMTTYLVCKANSTGIEKEIPIQIK